MRPVSEKVTRPGAERRSRTSLASAGGSRRPPGLDGHTVPLPLPRSFLRVGRRSHPMCRRRKRGTLWPRMAGEFDFVEWVRSQATEGGDFVVVPPGDDLAALK